MFFNHLPVILLALGSITSVVTSHPAQPRSLLQPREVVRPFAGNSGYTAETEVDESGTRWSFSVFADGYSGLGGQLLPVNTLLVNTATKRLTVMKAMNGYDTTTPRLKMREVLKECWKLAGLQPAEIKTVLGYRIVNSNMKAAIATCRSGMGLAAPDSFQVTNTETDGARKACWDDLGSTIFSSSIRGAIADFDINKELVQIQIDNGGDWDHAYYDFA